MSNTKRTERVTPASSETLLHMLETLPGALFVLNDTEIIVYANASAQAMPGATREEVCGKSFWRCAPHLVSPSLYQAVQKTRQTREPTDVAYVSPVTNRWLHVSLSPTDEGLALLFHKNLEPPHLQDAWRRNEQLYRDLLESFSDGVTIVTPEGLVLDINQRPLADAHLRREEALGKPLSDLPAWSSDPAVQERLRASIATAARGETVRFEARIHPRTDLSLDILMTITSHRDTSQQIEYLICAGRDITERKHAEDELRTLVDAIPQLVWTGRPDGYVDYYNQRWRDYTGLSTEQAQGNGWMQCTHPDDRQRVLAVWQSAVQTGGPYETEQRLRQSTTGVYRWFLMQAVPYKDAQGTILNYVGTCTDIDDRKQAEQRLKTSEENWRVLAETVPQLVWTTQPDGSVAYWNQRWYDYIGSSPKQSLGHEWSQFLHPDEYQQTLTAWRHALETGEPYEIEYRLKEGNTGSYRWFLTRGSPVRDDTGQIVKWFGTCTDIDDRKQAEQQLKASEENWRVLAETVPQLVMVARPDGLHEYVNQRWRDYTGLTLEHMQSDGLAHLQFIHPDDREGNRAHRQHAEDTGEMYEHEERLRNGQTGAYSWFLTRAMPVRNEAGQIVKWFGTATDIDEQKRTEEALRQSQERIRALIDSNIIGIVSVEGEEEVLVEANEAFLHMTGYTQEDVRSKTLNRVKITPPEQAHLFERARQEVTARGQHTPLETEVVCQDGSRLPVLVGSVLFQEHPRQTISFTLDNSARKELEQRKDAFISMASHELKTPLTALKLQTSLLQRQLAKQGIPASALSSMEGQINKVTRLVDELLDVSKIQVGRLEYLQETVDLEALLQEITETMQQSSPSHRIVVRGTVRTSLIGDPDRLGQVFINLLSNAIKYSPDAETVEMDLDASEEAVTIQVQDHGLGIPREQRDKIFERFYRASGPKQKAIPGLGMGLYIVAEIVKRHGGTITVESTVGEGSTFTVTLPRKRDA
ncbi:MAG TPA: PAS domain-containing sensor histidine kinase [Ktedonobacteraceae bacterium]|nr:PAS domain-containing sensor histidine kinase [Ktedonobacteraceae bacterium]